MSGFIKDELAKLRARINELERELNNQESIDELLYLFKETPFPHSYLRESKTKKALVLNLCEFPNGVSNSQLTINAPAARTIVSLLRLLHEERTKT